MIQLGYLSLLQNKEITTYLMPEASWSAVFGYNGLHLSPFPEEKFRSPYALYGYHKYFGFSNNVMQIVAAASFGLAGIVLLASFITSATLSRKLKRGAFLIANELSYTLVVFSTANMVTALSLESQAGKILDTSLVWSKSLLICSVIMILSTHAINLAMR